jgi:hypothetical protein
MRNTLPIIVLVVVALAGTAYLIRQRFEQRQGDPFAGFNCVRREIASSGEPICYEKDGTRTIYKGRKDGYDEYDSLYLYAPIPNRI